MTANRSVDGEGKQMRLTASLMVTPDAIREMAALSGDQQKLHADDTWAARTRFGRSIAHGLFAAGVVSKALGTGVGDAQVVFFTRQDYRYVSAIYPGETLDAEVLVGEPDRSAQRSCKVTVRARSAGESSGRLVLRGTAMVIIEALSPE